MSVLSKPARPKLLAIIWRSKIGDDWGMSPQETYRDGGGVFISGTKPPFRSLCLVLKIPFPGNGDFRVDEIRFGSDDCTESPNNRGRRLPGQYRARPNKPSRGPGRVVF
jgi:hypothetical protein